MTDPGPPTFTQVMTEHEDLTRRLSDLGTQPVPEAARAEHLHAMRTAEAVDAAPAGRRFGRLAVAAAAIIGFAVGSTGFAMAGALPDPAQGVAHDVLSVVQVDVPDRPDNRGACISAAAKNPDPAAKQAAKDACPKGGPPAGVPGGPPGEPGSSRGPGANRGVGNNDGDPCTGRPAWAGKMTPAEKEAAKAEAAAQCPGRFQDDGEPEELEAPEAPGADEIEEPPGS